MKNIKHTSLNEKKTFLNKSKTNVKEKEKKNV